MKITLIFKSSINYLKLLSEKYNYNHKNFYIRKFDEAYQKIHLKDFDLNENKIINEVHLQNLLNKYTFINNIIELRFNTNNHNIYRNSTIEIIKSYLEKIYIDNLDFGDDIFKTKDNSRANNIISNRRRGILNDLSDILYYIEIHFKSIIDSEEKLINTKSKNKEGKKEIKDFKDLFIKSYSETMDLLVKNKILDKEKNWPISSVDNDFGKLLCKLIESQIIEIENRKLKSIFPIITKSLNTEINYNNATKIIKRFSESKTLRNNDSFYKSLSFIDKINN